jgi:hypothetical protein
MRSDLLSLALGLLLTGGCATHYTVEWKAKPHVEWDETTQQNVDVPGKPAYYALLPLTVPFDIVTAPIQLCVLLAWPAAKTPDRGETGQSPPSESAPQ